MENNENNLISVRINGHSLFNVHNKEQHSFCVIIKEDSFTLQFSYTDKIPKSELHNDKYIRKILDTKLIYQHNNIISYEILDYVVKEQT